MQACLFADDYAILAAGAEDRQRVPKAEVVLSTANEDVPRQAQMVFRAWDERRGLWGTGGMMAGRASGGGGDGVGDERLLSRIDVREVLDICCSR